MARDVWGRRGARVKAGCRGGRALGRVRSGGDTPARANAKNASPRPGGRQRNPERPGPGSAGLPTRRPRADHGCHARLPISALLLALARRPDRWPRRLAAADPPPAPEHLLPADEVLRLLEEASGLESAGKSSLAGARGAGSPVVAAESLHSYDALHYRLDVTPSRTSRHVDGTVTLTLVVRDPAFTAVDLDAIAMTFSSITVAGSPRTTWTYAGGKLSVPVCEGPSCPPHAPGDTLVVAVTYACNPTLGYYYYARNSYTLSEPWEARYWWPCYDEPSDKTTLDLYATVPVTESCWSNGCSRACARGPRTPRLALARDASDRAPTW